MAQPKRKSKAAKILPKATLDKLKAPIAPLAPKFGKKLTTVPAMVIPAIRQITGDPNGKVFGLGEDGKVYLWNFVQGEWFVALQKPTIASPDPEAESNLDKAQGPATPQEDPLA